MSKSKRISIEVQGAAITIVSQDSQDFISLTDMAKKFGDDVLIYSWMRNRNTLEFIGIWEKIHNPDFKGLEFETFRTQAGLNSFSLTPRKWIQATGAIGFQSRAGRYGGGTYAHKDIAFEFGSWLSPEFKLYLIKEFQRLKDEESDRLKLDWNLQRTLAKINYRIHTDAIKDTLIPPSITKAQTSAVSTQGAWVSRPRSSSSRNTALRSTETPHSFLITDHCSHGTSPPHQPRKPQLRTHPPGSSTTRTPRHPQRHRHHPNADLAHRQQRKATQIVFLFQSKTCPRPAPRRRIHNSSLPLLTDH